MADIPSDSVTTSAPTAAQPVVHLDALPAGTRLSEFELQDLLGVGGFGLVYRAYDHSLHRKVAIKEYMPSALAARPTGLALSIRSSTDQATYDAGLQSFVAEARLLAQFDHPSLVKVYRFWEANNTAYMAMPLYSGVTLKQARAQMSAPPPEDWLRAMLWSILQALQVLHDHNTLHRDVSPDNIFLQDVGPPVLLDLGAARRAISDKSRQHTAILKVNYAPIEQFAQAEDLKQGPWTDLYALAAVVYHCLCNEPPMPATARVVRDSMPPVDRVAATVKEHFGRAYSEPFVRAIAHALAVQPLERPQNVQAFVEELGLQVPSAGLGRFDWRAALGGPLLSQARAQGENEATTQAESPAITQALTQPQAPAEQPLEMPAQVATPTSRRRWGWRLAWACLVALLGLWAYTLDWPSGREALVAAPEPAPMPVLVVPAPPEAEASDPTDPWPVAGPASAPVASPPAPAPRVAARPAKPQAKAATEPKPLCADVGFFRQPVCLFRECLKKENFNHPTCVASRRSVPNQAPE